MSKSDQEEFTCLGKQGLLDREPLPDGRFLFRIPKTGKDILLPGWYVAQRRAADLSGKLNIIPSNQGVAK